MIVQVATYLRSVGGKVEEGKYLRGIPGRIGYATLCNKPKYSKKEKKEMGKRPEVSHFKEMMAKVKAIMSDPEQLAMWTKKHAEAQREASRHQRQPDAKGKPYIPARLYDYIRREVMRQ